MSLPMNYTGKVARGAASELIASAHLMSLGYHVFRAVAASCPVDLIAYKSGEPPLRVEVKSVMAPAPGTKNSPAFTTPANDEWDILALVSNQRDVILLPYDSSVSNLREAFRRAAGLPPARPTGSRTHCLRGHEYTVDSVRITSSGSRSCKPCEKVRYRSSAA